MDKFLFRLIFIFFFASVFSAGAQAPPETLSSVNIDALSDQQVTNWIIAAKKGGLSEEQLIQQLQARGLPASEVAKLRVRVNRLSSNAGNLNLSDTSRRTLNYRPDSTAFPSTKLNATQTLKLPVFGADLFNNGDIRFEPNLKLATPLNYVLGPDDQLNISVNGVSEANWKLNISPEGTINIPGSGVLNVVGRTIAQATQLIKNKLRASNYPIGQGANLQVNLGNIRSIKIIIVGQVVKPGTYTLPSLATVFNALYSAGGPNNNGSFRKIEVIRGSRIIRHLDVYDFLVSGDQKDNISLQDQDVIRVPTYNAHVELAGQIKIPAIFEVLPGETLQNVIDFAGGFTDSAYTTRITVSQIYNQHRRITDILESDFSKYHPMRGDKFLAGTIVNRFDNRVTILGAVFRPGNYELSDGLNLSQLIEKADGLKEEAFMDRATITRLKPDNTTELISFSVKDIVNKKQTIALQREDIVRIASIFDLRDNYQVSITGLIRNPGTYAYQDSMKVEDLIFQAGGFAEGASTLRIEVARRITNADPMSAATSTAQIFTVNSNDKLSLTRANFTLKPFDIISVFSSPGYEKQRTVKVEGEVLYPGIYAIRNKDEKLSDLVKRVGGLTALADIEGSTLKRDNNAVLGIDENKIDANEVKQDRQDQRIRLKQSSQDTSRNLNEYRNNFVGINLKKVLAEPGSSIDLLLENNDVLRIPKKEQIVKVNGEVLFPSAIVYLSGKTFKSYVDNAGSFSANAWPKRSYIVYPNGTVRSTHKFLFFKVYPDVKPGSEIYVPRKPVKIGNSVQEIFGITTGLASLGAIILGIISLKK